MPKHKKHFIKMEKHSINVSGNLITATHAAWVMLYGNLMFSTFNQALHTLIFRTMEDTLMERINIIEAYPHLSTFRPVVVYWVN